MEYVLSVSHSKSLIQLPSYFSFPWKLEASFPSCPCNVSSLAEELNILVEAVYIAYVAFSDRAQRSLVEAAFLGTLQQPQKMATGLARRLLLAAAERYEPLLLYRRPWKKAADCKRPTRLDRHHFRFESSTFKRKQRKSVNNFLPLISIGWDAFQATLLV